MTRSSRAYESIRIAPSATSDGACINRNQRSYVEDSTNSDIGDDRVPFIPECLPQHVLLARKRSAVLSEMSNEVFDCQDRVTHMGSFPIYEDGADTLHWDVPRVEITVADHIGQANLG